MAIVKQVVGTKAALTVTGLSTLASATYAVSAVKDNTTNQPLDLLVELSATVGVVATPFAAYLFAKASLDNVNYGSGPESGTTATDEPDLVFIGAVPANTSSIAHTRQFSVASQFAGVLPPYLKFVVKNSTGAAFTAGTLSVSEVSSTVV